MIQRTGEVVIRMLADVKQKTIGPLIRATITPGSTVYTDEYDIYARLPERGHAHRTVCHASGEYARDDDGGGFCEVHVNTMEGKRIANTVLIRSGQVSVTPGRRWGLPCRPGCPGPRWRSGPRAGLILRAFPVRHVLRPGVAQQVVNEPKMSSWSAVARF